MREYTLGFILVFLNLDPYTLWINLLCQRNESYSVSCEVSLAIVLQSLINLSIYTSQTSETSRRDSTMTSDHIKLLFSETTEAGVCDLGFTLVSMPWYGCYISDRNVMVNLY